jgi:hypothetical protein
MSRTPALHKLCQLLATLQPSARDRVMIYISARAGSLPVIAGVGGGIEGDTRDDQPLIFPRADRESAVS